MAKSSREKPFSLDGYIPSSVVTQLRYAILTALKDGRELLPEIQGRELAKRDVLRALLSGNHPYLVSEEGTGKTRLARSLAKLLPAVPAVKGCPYHDDPLWGVELLCPRCREVANPLKEFGWEMVLGERRFSRIQGNEYTNEAKFLGLKDIQAIAQGRSPADPGVFTGTGVFRANRGILFVDELPAIPTKVQVLLHPVLEEKKVVLEEYNWQHPVDLVLVATGNPQGFSHVNEVPRPLLDRLELIYFDLPTEEVEREIALRERFALKKSSNSEEPERLVHPNVDQVERQVALPWWIIFLANKAVRQSRTCRWLERGASIRGTTRTLDHTYATVELERKNIANLKDLAEGLKLALRGRVALRTDLVDFERPKESFVKTDEVVEDLLWSSLEDFTHEWPQWDGEKLAREIDTLLSRPLENLGQQLQDLEELNQAIRSLQEQGKERADGDLLNGLEKKLLYQMEGLTPGEREEYLRSALELLINIAIHKGIISELPQGPFTPQMVSWGRKR